MAKRGEKREKTGGRVKGTPNKFSGKVKEILTEIVNNNSEKAQKMLDMIVEPKDWLMMYLKMCEFVIPKMAAVDVKAEAKVSDLRSELTEMANTEE